MRNRDTTNTLLGEATPEPRPRPPRLPPRLAALAARIPAGVPFADLATGHARLPAAAVAGGRSPCAIAIDAAPQALDESRRVLRAAGVADRVALRRADGFLGLAEAEVATVTIAGIGGRALARILARPAPRGLGRLLLQVLGDPPAARAVLLRSGWRPVAEDLVEDRGRIYWLAEAIPAPPLDPATVPRLVALGTGLPGDHPLRRRHLTACLRNVELALAAVARAAPHSPRLPALQRRATWLRAALAGG